MAVTDTAIIDAIIDIGAFTGNIADIANITIYLQDDDSADIANITIYLQDDDTADIANTTVYL